MAARESQPKWDGRVCTELKRAGADEVWPLLEDFFSIHKWLPDVDECHQVEGASGQPGCVRYCAATKSSSDGGAAETIHWAKEKLIKIDPTHRCFTYEITDNNVGFNSYVATIRVLPSDVADQRGCRIEWSFFADPIEGWKLEDFVSYIEYSLQHMGSKMEESLQAVQ